MEDDFVASLTQVHNIGKDLYVIFVKQSAGSFFGGPPTVAWRQQLLQVAGPSDKPICWLPVVCQLVDWQWIRYGSKLLEDQRWVDGDNCCRLRASSGAIKEQHQSLYFSKPLRLHYVSYYIWNGIIAMSYKWWLSQVWWV